MDNRDRSSNYRSSIIIHFESLCIMLPVWKCSVHDFPSQKNASGGISEPAMWMITSGQLSRKLLHIFFHFQSFSDFSDLMFGSQVKGTFLLTVTKVQASISLWTININHVQEKKNMKKLDLPLPLWNTLDMFLKPNRQVPKLHFRQVTVQWVSLRWPLRRRLFWSLWGSHWPNRWCIACWTGENRKGPRWLKTGVDTLCNNWSCFHANEVHGKILILKIQNSAIEHFL